jgi:hypothetical protein
MPFPTCGATIAETAFPSQILAKRWRADGACEGYSAAKRFNLSTVPLASLDDLRDLLQSLADRPRCAILRGAIADPARARGVRRLLHPDPETGEGATLTETPRRWGALDIDRLPLPGGTDPRDLEACAAAVAPRLPPAFRGARCIVQATSGHAIKPGAHLRLWFGLSRPATGAELARWLAGSPADPSCFRGAQLTYTARPIFEGRPDPLTRRLAMLPGREAVEVPPAELLRAPPPPPPPPRSAAIRGDGSAALRWAEAEIARQSEGARHDTALRVAGWLAGLARRGELAPGDIPGAIGRGLAAAGKNPAEGLAIAAFCLAREGLA